VGISSDVIWGKKIKRRKLFDKNEIKEIRIKYKRRNITVLKESN
jgi:hypothetical protein